jgi:lipopolysaccharide export system protein LptA
VLFLASIALSASSLSAQVPLSLESDRQSGNIQTGIYQYSGNFVAIGPGVVIAADEVSYSSKDKKVEGSGHVVLISGSQAFLGEKIVYFEESGDFLIENAVMVVNDKPRTDKMVYEILGLSFAELQFEVARKSQLANLGSEKVALQSQAKSVVQLESEKAALTQRYVRLLEREAQTRDQYSPQMSQLHPSDREQTLRRRDVWNKAQKEDALRSKQSYFLKIKGEEIERSNGNDFRAKEALLTPCRCEDDEAPAWGLRTESTIAQLGGYADLYHPVLEIKGLPVLYLPYLKLPIKDQRQSGLLMPVFENNRRSGNILSQPIYFALDEHYDATLNLDFFEKRGTRLGGEFRVKTSEHSGWELNLEGIRDTAWGDSRALRQDMYNIYSEGLERAAANDTYVPGVSDREILREKLSRRETWAEIRGYEGCFTDPATENLDLCRELLANDFLVPQNTMRGSYSWNGRSFWTPRLSLVSQGKVLSDHRYDGDFQISDTTLDSIFSNDVLPIYALTASEVQFEDRNFSMAVGNRYMDLLTSSSRFYGRQIPAKFKTQTRLFPVVERLPLLGSSIYQDFRLESVRVDQFSAPELPDRPAAQDGDWSNLRATTMVPLMPRSVFDLNTDAELNQSWIQADGFDGRSTIQYWRFGLSTQLPITGEWDYGSQEDQKEITEQNLLQHQADFVLSYDLIPEVQRRGDYATGILETPTAAYFPDADLLKPSRILSFGLTNQWGLFDRKYQRLSGSSSNKNENLWERADRELFGPFQPVSSADQLFVNKDWLIDRFVLTDERKEQFAFLSSSTGYDFEEARLAGTRFNPQGELIKAQPWQPLKSTVSFSYWGALLQGDSRYNLNFHLPDETSILLQSMPFWDSYLRLHLLRDNFFNVVEGSLDTTQDITTMTLGTSLIRRVSLASSWQQIMPAGGPVRHGTQMKLEYRDPSDCWGLYFERTESIEKTGRTPSYALRLIVDFLGQSRKLGSFSSLTKRFPNQEEAP